MNESYMGISLTPFSTRIQSFDFRSVVVVVVVVETKCDKIIEIHKRSQLSRNDEFSHKRCLCSSSRTSLLCDGKNTCKTPRTRIDENQTEIFQTKNRDRIVQTSRDRKYTVYRKLIVGLTASFSGGRWRSRVGRGSARPLRGHMACALPRNHR